MTALPIALRNPDKPPPAVWTSLSAAHKAVQSTTLSPYISTAASVCTAPPTVLYVSFDPAPSQPALDAPATEVVIAYFAADASAETTAAVPGVLPKVLKLAGAKDAGMIAESGGWAQGEVKHASLLGEGAKGRAFVSVVGWESVEAHRAFRETEAFKANVGLLRGAGQKGMEMFHIAR